MKLEKSSEVSLLFLIIVNNKNTNNYEVEFLFDFNTFSAHQS